MTLPTIPHSQYFGRRRAAGAARSGGSRRFNVGLTSLIAAVTLTPPLHAESPIWDHEAANGGIGRLVRTDPARNVYVAGETDTDDLYVAKFSPNGTLLWERTYAGSGGGIDTASDLAVDAAGNVYLAATVFYDDGTRNREACAVLKWTSSGVLSWTRFALGQSTWSFAGGIALDETNGRVYVTGYTWHPTQNYNMMTLRYSTGGSTVWATPAYYNNGSEDQGRRVAVGADGAVYVAGESSFNNAGTWTRRVVVIRYDPVSGAAVWTKRNDDVPDFDATAMAKDDAGNLLLSCTDSVMKFSTAGARLWRGAFSRWLADVDVDAAGDVYAAAPGDGANPGDVVKYRGSDGLLLWSHPVRIQDCDVYCEALRFNRVTGNVWVVGQRRQCSAATPEAFGWAEYSSAGTLRDSGLRSFGDVSRAKSLAIDACGAIALTGIGDAGVTTLKLATVPIAVDDDYVTDEDVPLQNADLSGNDVHPCGFTYLKKTNPQHGSASVNASSGMLTYTPSANWSGSDSFTYAITDGVYESSPATVSITVNAVNDPPTAVDDDYSVAEDATLNVALPGVMSNDSDVDTPASNLRTKVHRQPAHGVVTVGLKGDFRYVPFDDYAGSDSFQYELYELGDPASSDIGAVTITVTPVDDPPVAVDDAYTTNEDTALDVASLGVLANDIDIDTPASNLRTQVHRQPLHGVVTVGPRGDFRYVPLANYSGSDSFQYEVYELGDPAMSDIGTVDINVAAVNDPPVSQNDAYNATEDVALNIAAPGVLGNDSDIDSAGITAVKETNPSHGAVTLNSDGSFVYTPAADYNGPDSFKYHARDAAGANSASTTVSITVAPVPDTPVAVDDAYTIEPNLPVFKPASEGVLKNDTDADQDALHCTLFAPALRGIVFLNSDGSFTYIPPNGYTGTDTFVYKALDPGGRFDLAVVTITIVAACDPCDANCDGSVNQFDIGPFVAAVTTHHGCSPCAGDMNGNGTTNQFDIGGFLGCLAP